MPVFIFECIVFLIMVFIYPFILAFYFIKTYNFGIVYYDLFVLADSESNMLRTVYKYPLYNKDEDSEIVKYEEVDLNNSENRVL